MQLDRILATGRSFAQTPAAFKGSIRRLHIDTHQFSI